MAKGAYIGVNTKIYTNSIGDLAVGSVIKINENGSPVDYIVVHQGNPNPTMYDASCDGVWVLRKDIYETTTWDGSDNDYANSDIHAYLNADFLALFDVDIKAQIKTVKLPYTKGTGFGGSLTSGSSGLSAQVFLLSYTEVGFDSSSYANIEGTVLDYFNGISASDRVGYYSGTATYWWLRSPRINTAGGAWVVHSNGAAYSNSIKNLYGVRPAFILPSSLKLTNGVVTGAEASYTTKSVARKIKGGYIGIEGEIYPNSVGLLPVGSTVKINENGSPVDYLVVHQGNPNPTMYDASCDGTWVLRKDLVVFNTMGYHYNDYGASYMHNNLLNGTFLATLDTLVQNSIVQVKIPYYNRNGIKGSLATGASGLSAQVFLLSIRELGINTTTRPSSHAPVDGTALQYFESASDSKRIANYNGSAYVYWTRTPTIGSSGMMNCIMNNGQDTINDFSGTAIGARPAFVLPSTLLVSNGIVNGEQAELTRSGISRKIKKAYIGIGGVARPCWSGGELAYYGVITSRNGCVSNINTSASMGGKMAAFNQGTYNSSNNTVLDVYNSSLVRTTFTKSTTDMFTSLTATDTHFILFGNINSNYSNTPTVNAFDSTGTRIDTSLDFTPAHTNGGNFGMYCIIAGYQRGSTVRNFVTAFDTSLTEMWPSGLSTSRGDISFVQAGSYMILAGGYTGDSNYTNATDAYNSSLTKVSSITTLSKARSTMGCASVDKYGIFAGGGWDTMACNDIDIFDDTLTRTTSTLPETRRYIGGVGLEGYAVFAGGQKYGSSEADAYTNKITHFDTSLTQFSTLTLTNSKSATAARAGNYGLISIESSLAMEAVVVA